MTHPNLGAQPASIGGTASVTVTVTVQGARVVVEAAKAPDVVVHNHAAALTRQRVSYNAAGDIDTIVHEPA